MILYAVNVEGDELYGLAAQIEVQQGVAQREVEQLTFPDVILRDVFLRVVNIAQVVAVVHLEVHYAGIVFYTFGVEGPLRTVLHSCGQR